MSNWNERTGLIAYLAGKSPAQWIGRTALMKYCYFLQELHGVPLGYYFSLYSYGPFDSAVLSDLGEAEALGVVKEISVLYPGGYGYQISSTVSGQEAEQLGGKLLEKYQADVDWVIQEFGNLSAADLELQSTIVYVDREAVQSSEKIPLHELVRKVRDVKPRFPEDYVRRHVLSLKDKKFLAALAE